jgi:hypothetical protein
LKLVASRRTYVNPGRYSLVPETQGPTLNDASFDG